MNVYIHCIIFIGVTSWFSRIIRAFSTHVRLNLLLLAAALRWPETAPWASRMMSWEQPLTATARWGGASGIAEKRSWMSLGLHSSIRQSSRNGGFWLGKSSINGGFSIATFDYRSWRVISQLALTDWFPQ